MFDWDAEMIFHQKMYCEVFREQEKLSWLKNPIKKIKLIITLMGIQDEIDECERRLGE